jgi:hypothetical protein
LNRACKQILPSMCLMINTNDSNKKLCSFFGCECHLTNAVRMVASHRLTNVEKHTAIRTKDAAKSHPDYYFLYKLYK